MSVLVVSRDSVVRDLLSVILKQRGYKVGETYSLAGALPKIAAGLRAAFVDVRPQAFWEAAELPDFQGKLGEASLILVQDSDGQGGLDDALAVGADAVVMLPFSSGTILEVLGRLAPRTEDVSSRGSVS